MAVRPNISVDECVSLGAAFMDEHCPGWSEDYNPFTANMNTSEGHVLSRYMGTDLSDALNRCVNEEWLPSGEAGYSRVEELGLLLYRATPEEYTNLTKLWIIEAFKRNFPQRWETLAKELP